MAHVWYMYHHAPTFTIKSTIHVGKYISAMDPMEYTRNQQISDTLLKFNLATEELSGFIQESIVTFQPSFFGVKLREGHRKTPMR